MFAVPRVFFFSFRSLVKTIKGIKWRRKDTGKREKSAQRTKTPECTLGAATRSSSHSFTSQGCIDLTVGAKNDLEKKIPSHASLKGR